MDAPTVFDTKRMRRLIEQDEFLSFTWARERVDADREERLLKAYFNTYVLENSIMMDRYLELEY